jgi:hypothetical protein
MVCQEHKWLVEYFKLSKSSKIIIFGANNSDWYLDQIALVYLSLIYLMNLALDLFFLDF